MYYVDEYKADRKRYETMQYNRCGKSGLKLPAVSLGLWHNFGSKDNYDMMKNLCFTAFDNGITHFDPSKVFLCRSVDRAIVICQVKMSL